MICRALVPAASNCELIPGNAVKARRGCEVVRVSTKFDVVRSKVLTVWSWEAEYATVESSGLKIAAETGAVCDEIIERGPRWGVDVEVVIFRRFAVGPEVRSDAEAAGAEFLSVVHKPIAPSADAERILFEGPWTSIESMLPLWPYSSRIGFKSAEK